MNKLISSGLALAFMFPVAHAASDYEFRAVDFPGAANTALYAVNDRGAFVGGVRG